MAEHGDGLSRDAEVAARGTVSAGDTPVAGPPSDSRKADAQVGGKVAEADPVAQVLCHAIPFRRLGLVREVVQITRVAMCVPVANLNPFALVESPSEV